MDAAFWGEPIASYSRAEAIADGELVDITPASMLFGISCPVALTARLYAALGCAESIQAARLLRALRRAALLGVTGDRVGLALRAPSGDWVSLYLLAHGGDDGEMVWTVMLEGED